MGTENGFKRGSADTYFVSIEVKIKKIKLNTQRLGDMW